MYLDEAIGDRRSVREFRTVRVDSALITKVLDAGRQAPSAKNNQPWAFFVETDKTVIGEISGAMLTIAKSENLISPQYSVVETANCISTAPVIICLYTPREKTWSESDYISIGACLENMCLKATDLGLGSLIACDCWCAETAINKLVNCDQHLAAILAVGYALKDGKPAPKKELESIVYGLDIISDSIIEDLPEINLSENKSYVFISYCHKDKRAVIRDIIELKKLGVSLWYDRSIAIGYNWDDTAIKHLNDERCKGMILYISENSLVSKNVERELIDAVEVKKLPQKSIITVHIGDKAISQYDVEIANGFKEYLSESKVYIPRGYNAMGNTLAIKEAVEPLCVIYDSGLYEDIVVQRVDGGVEIKKYNGTSKRVSVPATIGDEIVVSIGNNAFSYNDTLESVTLPYSLKRIEEGAFFGCTKLISLYIPDGVEHVGTATFRDCVALTSIHLPSKITVLSEAIFRDCTSLTSCVVPYGVTELKEAVFRGCISLQSVTLPKTVKKMTNQGFYGCYSLTELVIPTDIQGLDANSFDTCPMVSVCAGGYAFRHGKGEKIV